MGIDVSPIVQRGAAQPVGSGKRSPAIAGTEHDDGTGDRWERQEVHLVFGDENTLRRQGERGEAVLIQGDVGQSCTAGKLGKLRIEQAQTDANGLAKKAVATGK